MARVRVGGLVFEEAPENLDEAYVIAPQGLSGWFEGIAVRNEDVPRPNAHGSFDAPTFAAARVPAIEGNIIAPSAEILDRMRLALTGILGVGRKGRMVVDGPTGATWADVRRVGQPQLGEATTGTESTFQVQFWAPNPRRYGDVQTTIMSTAATAFHRGNFEAHAIVEVTGWMPGGYTLPGPNGEQFVVKQDPNGATHRIDMATGRLYLNGVLQIGQVARAETWTIPPGAQIVHTITPAAVTGQGFLRVLTTDTYI